MANIFVSVTICVFDLIAFGLATAAEQRRSTAVERSDSEYNYSYCVYDSDISTGLGVGALLFLLLSQLIVVFATKCFCCGRALKPGGARACALIRALKPGGARACALILFLLSWVTFLIAEGCLLAGSVRNAYHTRYRAKFQQETLNCQTVRKGVFGAGAAFIIFTAILTEFYYGLFSRADKPYDGLPSNGVGMAAYR